MNSETDRTAEARGLGGRRRWGVMLLVGALSVAAVAALGDRGFLAAAVLLSGGVLLARRLGRGAGAAVREDRMTTDPWQGEGEAAPPPAKRRRGTRSIQRLG